MLSIAHVSVNYGGSQILHDISLEVPAGQVVCILGRNGVGKTTLLKAIMGVLKTRAGRVALDDADLSRATASERARAGIAYVPQGRGIFPYLTVYENLVLGFEALPRRQPNPAALEQMYALFPVLRQMRGRVAGTLSGGQQQQLALARALVREPRVLLLDEPTEGIQPSIMQQIEEVIVELRREGRMAILLVEQFLDFALDVGDHFYVLDTGAVVARGPIADFSADIAHTYLAV